MGKGCKNNSLKESCGSFLKSSGPNLIYHLQRPLPKGGAFCYNTPMETTRDIVNKIAYLVAEAGGRAYYVGGFVRDRLMGRPGKDVDMEVHGIQPEALWDILTQVGEPKTFGASFGVYSLRGYDIDIAMPRKESAIGRGHRDFEVYVDPFLGTTEAARRRDFTVNSLMEDILTGEVLDPFDGQADLVAGVLRHVDDRSFPEDPLRVLRCAQFASRFEFSVAEETIALCRGINLEELSRERVEEELKKALLKGSKPSLFFETLRAMDQLDTWFPELKQLIDLPQDPIYHPEGDVWIHTMQVLDRAAAYRDRVDNPYAFMLLALTHDLGKIVTTGELNGRIHAYGHETAGMPLVKAFIRRITAENDIKKYIYNMVPLHMKPNMVGYSRSKLTVTNRMFDSAAAPLDLVYFAECDAPVMAGDNPFSGNTEFLMERLETYAEIMSRPHVTGQDLLDAGIEPGPNFSLILAHAHKLRLAGIDKESALKQTLGFARKLK